MSNYIAQHQASNQPTDPASGQLNAQACNNHRHKPPSKWRLSSNQRYVRVNSARGKRAYSIRPPCQRLQSDHHQSLQWVVDHNSNHNNAAASNHLTPTPPITSWQSEVMSHFFCLPLTILHVAIVLDKILCYVGDSIGSKLLHIEYQELPQSILSLHRTAWS